MPEYLDQDPVLYRRKLIQYAADTTFYTDGWGIKRKMNKNGHPTVVEDMGDHFKIYERVQSPPRFNHMANPVYALRGGVYALVYFPQGNIDIKIHWNKQALIVHYIGMTLFSIIAIIAAIKGETGFQVILFFPFLILLYDLRSSKAKFKKFTITFLNYLAKEA